MDINETQVNRRTTHIPVMIVNEDWHRKWPVPPTEAMDASRVTLEEAEAFIAAHPGQVWEIHRVTTTSEITRVR